MTPADELRAAADKLRSLAATATEGPWHQSGIGDQGWTVDAPKAFIAETEDSEKGRADADYIAAMHPGVAKALVGWLEAEEFRVLHNGRGPELHHALAVARAINRSQP
jgi:hypothetical protein